MATAKPRTRATQQRNPRLRRERILIVADEVEANLHLSARNLPHVQVVDADAADPVSLVSHDRVLIDEGALRKMEARLT